MTYDNEAIVRNAYHTAEGNVLDIPGWTGSFTKDGVFNNISGEESYRGEHLKDIVITFARMFPDVHRELHRVNVMGDVVAIELSIQGTFRGPMETPAGVVQPTGAKVNIPCADFFYMRNGKIERFDCYPAINIMLKQWACRLTSLPPSSVRRTLTAFSVHDGASLNLAPCGGDWADLRRGSHESCQIVGIRWAVGAERCTDTDDCSRRDLGQDQEYSGQSSGSC